MRKIARAIHKSLFEMHFHRFLNSSENPFPIKDFL